MRLAQVPNFRAEDFPREQSWIGKLFIPLNSFIQSLNQVLQNIDFSTNIRSIVKSYNLPNLPSFSQITFAWPYRDLQPQSVVITKATKGSSPSPTILLLAWRYNASTLNIEVTRMVEVTTSGVSDLSGTYNFTIRASV